MKLIKIVDYTRPYTSKKDGKEHPNVNFYCESTLDNGRVVRVCVKPAFEKHIASDLQALSILCDEVRILGDKPEGVNPLDEDE